MKLLARILSLVIILWFPNVVFGNSGPVLEEQALFKLSYNRSIDTFELLIERFNQSPSADTAEIGGFVFVPYRFEAETGLPLAYESATESDTIKYVTRGFRVFLSYYSIKADGGKEIKFFGFENNPLTVTRGIPTATKRKYYFPLYKPEELGRMRFLPNEQPFVESIPEIELSYLSIDDYYYLARESSYYTTGNLPSNRAIRIERAIVGQTFNLNRPDTDNSLNQYRTLSFRPYPRPEIVESDEAIMAYKYGYYCPPTWGSGGGSGGGGNLTGGEPKEAGRMLRFSGQNSSGNSSSSASEDATFKVLEIFLNDQLAKREQSVRDFAANYPEYCVSPNPNTDPTTEWPWYWWLLAIFIFIIGLILGRFGLATGEGE